MCMRVLIFVTEICICCGKISLQLDSIPEVTNSNKRPNDKYAWIDTVGWNDAEFEDDETFKDILRFIDDNYMTSVKGCKIIQPLHRDNFT